MDNNGYQPDTSSQGHVGHQELQPHSAVFQPQYDTAYQQPHATMNQTQNDMAYQELQPQATMNQSQYDRTYQEIQPQATMSQPQQSMGFEQPIPAATHTPGEPVQQSPPVAQASGFQEPPPGYTTKTAYNGPPPPYYPPPAPGVNVNCYNNQYMGNQPVPVVVAQPMATSVRVVQTETYGVRPVLYIRPQSYMGLACCTFWCVNILFGLFAMIASMISMGAYGDGDIEKARKLGKVSLYLSLIGWIVSAVLVMVLFIILLAN